MVKVNLLEAKKIKEFGFKSKKAFKDFIKKHNINGRNKNQEQLETAFNKVFYANRTPVMQNQSQNTGFKRVQVIEIVPKYDYEAKDEYVFFTRYYNYIRQILNQRVRKGSIKTFFSLKTRFGKQNEAGELITRTVFITTNNLVIGSENQVKDVLNQHISRIKSVITNPEGTQNQQGINLNPLI